MGRRAAVVAVMLGLLLSGCAKRIPEVEEILPAVEVLAAEESTEVVREREAEAEAEEATRLEAGAESRLFGTWAATLVTENGRMLVEAEAIAEGGRLILQQEADAAVFCRLGERLRLKADGENAHWQDGTLWVDAERVAERFGFAWGQTEDGTVWFAREMELGAVTENVNVPVLMYHAVGDETWGYEELFVRPSELENHLKYLTENGYETIFFEDLTHLEDFEKPVLLTFDDGYDDNYTELYPLLQKYQAKATIFVIPRDFGVAHKMTAEQAREMAESGLVSIQSHTWSHGNLAEMDEEALVDEMERSRDAIAALTGEVPYVVCYPEGHYSELSIEVARRYYRFGLLMNGYTWNTSEDAFYVQRMYIPRGQWDISWNVTKAGTSDVWR